MAGTQILVSADFKYLAITVQIQKPGSSRYTRSVWDGNPHEVTGAAGDQFFLAWKRNQNATFDPQDIPNHACVFAVGDEPIIFSGLNTPCAEVPPPTYCFAEGTPVVMADGSRKAIEEVRPNDMVLSLVGPDDEEGPVQVESVSQKFSIDTVALNISTGEIIVSSPTQPIVTIAGPVLAEHLADDAPLYVNHKSRLRLAPGSVTVTARIQKAAPRRVLSLHLLNGSHFFVGNSVAIRSNCKGGGNGGGCFASGTLILMPDNSSKNIEDVELGDTVVAVGRPFDGFNSAKVINRTRKNVPFVVCLSPSVGPKIYCSDDQPVRTIAGPVRAGDLFLGAELAPLMSSGVRVEHTALLSGRRDVHTLELEGGKDFVVGTHAHPTRGEQKK